MQNVRVGSVKSARAEWGLIKRLRRHTEWKIPGSIRDGKTARTEPLIRVSIVPTLPKALLEPMPQVLSKALGCLLQLGAE